MDSTVPADLLDLKDRLEAWRANRKYTRQPIPDEFRQATAEMARRYSPSLVRRLLKLDPWRLKKPETKRSDRVHRKPQTTFFTLPPDRLAASLEDALHGIGHEDLSKNL